MDNSRMKDWINGQSLPIEPLTERLRRRADSTKWHDDYLLLREAANEIERLRPLPPPPRPAYALACCDNEKRNMEGGCDSCGDLCL